MIIANEPCTDQLLQESTSLFVSLYFRLLWYHSILRGSIDKKHAITNEIWRQNSEIHSAFACSRWPPSMISRSFQTVRRMREAWKWERMFGLSLFRPSWQSNISTSREERFKYPLPWENKISQNALPQRQQRQSNPYPMPPCPASPPPPSAGITVIGAFFDTPYINPA